MRRSLLVVLACSLSFAACDSEPNFDTPLPPVQAGDAIPTVRLAEGTEWTYAWTTEEYWERESGALDSLVFYEKRTATAQVASDDARLGSEGGLVRVEYRGEGEGCEAEWFRVLSNRLELHGRSRDSSPSVGLSLFPFRMGSSTVSRENVIADGCDSNALPAVRYEPARVVFRFPIREGQTFKGIAYVVGDTTIVEQIAVTELLQVETGRASSPPQA